VTEKLHNSESSLTYSDAGGKSGFSFSEDVAKVSLNLCCDAVPLTTGEARRGTSFFRRSLEIKFRMSSKSAIMQSLNLECSLECIPKLAAKLISSNRVFSSSLSLSRALLRGCGGRSVQGSKEY
jgi:hypothetical protein